MTITAINLAATEYGRAYDKAVTIFNRLMRKIEAIPGKYAAKHKLFSMVRELAETQRTLGKTTPPAEIFKRPTQAVSL